MRPRASATFMDVLPAASARRLRAAATRVRYGANTLIHSRGDDKPGLSIVESGRVLVGVYGQEGAFIAAALLGPGQTFGEHTMLAGLPRTHDAVAAEPTAVLQLPAGRFTPLYEEDPEIARALLTTALVRQHVLLELFDTLRRLPTQARAAQLLLSLTATSGEHTSVPVRQSDLAQMLGVSRVTVSKALKALSEQGLVELGYGAVRIPDPGAVAAWVERQGA